MQILPVSLYNTKQKVSKNNINFNALGFKLDKQAPAVMEYLKFSTENLSEIKNANNIIEQAFKDLVQKIKSSLNYKCSFKCGDNYKDIIANADEYIVKPYLKTKTNNWGRPDTVISYDARLGFIITNGVDEYDFPGVKICYHSYSVEDLNKEIQESKNGGVKRLACYIKNFVEKIDLDIENKFKYFDFYNYIYESYKKKAFSLEKDNTTYEERLKTWLE